MTPARLRTVLAAVAVVVGLVVAVDAGLPPGPTVEATVLALATVVALKATSRLPMGEHRRGAGRVPAVTVPDELATARDQVLAGTTSAGGLHFLLVPPLRRAAAHRCERHGVDLADAGRARALLGDELHDLVRPDRARPRDREAPGVAVATLAAAVARLERL